jgi:translocation and assembly module TamA
MIGLAVLRAVRRFAVALALSLAAGAASGQGTLQVELQAPESVRELLERHVRVLSRPDQTVPEALADRIALMRRTRREVAELLATEGYFSPQIELERTTRERWALVVVPGERAHVTEVELAFEGHLAAEGDEFARRRDALRRAWLLPPGAPFRQSAWDAAKQQLLDAVAVRDYAAARISASRATVDPEAASVRLAVTIDSGPPFFIGPLEVTGLERLPAHLVARYSTLRQGERFDQERLLAFQSLLQNAPQFASVIVDIDRDPALASAVPVRVQVSEAQSRHLSFGAGFSTNTGARAETNWRDVNLRGRAWELSTGLRIEQRRQAAYADVFLPPAQARHRDSFGAVIETSDIEGLETSRQAIGAVRSKQRGDIETAIGLRYQHENLRPAGAESSSRNALTANWSWVQRKVDDLLDPRRGYVLQVDLGGGAKALLSDQDFFRAYARVVRYQPVGERDVFIVRAEAGATLAKSRDGIPQDFLFRTGGAQSVRGYAYNSLGVQQGQAVLGGRYLGTASAEYVHWFRPQWGVAGFVDVGDAADDRDSLDLKAGYGAGARWRSPAGPLALDLAYGHHERRLRLHFAIAIAF